MKKELKAALQQVEFSEERREQILEKLLSEYDRKTEKENISMNIRMKKRIISAVASIAVIFIISGTAYATQHWLSGKEVAENLGSEELSRYFEPSDIEQTSEIGEYRFALLGIAASVRLSEQFLGDIDQESTYVAVAAERVNGSPITEETFVASPLIQGLDPAEYNIYSMGGGATYYVENGICYMIVCCDSIEMFADRQIYLAVTQGPDYKTGYEYDNSSGLISRREDFDGINALFSIHLDASKADSGAQQDYLNGMKQKTDYSPDTADTGCKDIDFFLNYDYESLTTEKIERLEQIGSTIDHNEFALTNGYYHIKYENEYGGAEGDAAAEMFQTDTPVIGVSSYNNEGEIYVIFEYERVDQDQTLHVKNIKYDEAQLAQAMELLK